MTNELRVVIINNTTTIFIDNIPLIFAESSKEEGHYLYHHTLSDMEIQLVFPLNNSMNTRGLLISGIEKVETEDFSYLLPIQGPISVSKKLKGKFKKYIGTNYVLRNLKIRG